MNIFDILGPVMVGPSSSHTAGAVRIGLVTKKLLGSVPARAHITLTGSFSATGIGHGTDRALVAGLLGMRPDNICIPESLRLNMRRSGAPTPTRLFWRCGTKGGGPCLFRLLPWAEGASW